VAVADGLHLPVTVDGGAGDDDMEGGDQGDVLDGGDGADTVYGNGGADVVRGGPGNDEIGGGTGVDTLDGGTGNDAVGAWDEAADVAPVTCGSGLDTVDYDYGLDTISSDCETLPPHIEGPVLISGQPTVGMVLTRSTPATSGGTPTAWYTYWKRCDAWHWECEDIPGAEDASYRLTAEDRGALIQVAVYAGNGAGYDGVVSDPTAVIGVPDPTLEPRAAGPRPRRRCRCHIRSRARSASPGRPRWPCAAPPRRSTPVAPSRAPPAGPRAGSAPPLGRPAHRARSAAGPRSPARRASAYGRAPARRWRSG
jgi:hypothetical protein